MAEDTRSHKLASFVATSVYGCRGGTVFRASLLRHQASERRALDLDVLPWQSAYESCYPRNPAS